MSVGTIRTLARREARAAWAPVIWAAISLVCFVAANMGIFVVNAVVRLFADVPHLFEMAEWSVVWGVLALIGVLLGGRVAFGRWLSLNAAALVVAGTGIALSAIVHVVLQQWAVARFGYYDPEFVWWTAGSFAVLIGLATSAFGVFVSPRGAESWPLAFVLLGGALVILIVLGNLPGLADGIEPASWQLAIWLGISGLYAAGVTIATVMRARNTEATLEQ
jgi:hypothetical protein